MIQRALDMMKRFLNHEIEQFSFSINMEKFLVDHYDEMYQENPGLTEFLNEELPDICATGEPGEDFPEMYISVAQQLQKAKQYL